MKSTTIDFKKMARAKRDIRGLAYRSRDDGLGFNSATVDILLKAIGDTELKVLIDNARELFRLKGEIEKNVFWSKKQYNIN